MSTAILGGGNGAHMMAAHLALAGEGVRMIEHPQFEKSFRRTMQSGQITVSGIGPNGVAQLERATTDFAAGLESATWIHVVMSASGHQMFFEAMLPHLREEQKVVVWAGNMASVKLYGMLRKAKLADKVDVLETNTLPYGTRLKVPGHVELLLWARMVEIASMPGNRNVKLQGLKRHFPQLKTTPSVLVTTLNNPNPTVHPAASLLNIGRIEHSQGDFYLYGEGLTASPAKVIRALFDESAAIARRFGQRLTKYSDEDFREPASVMGAEFKGPGDSLAVIGSIKGPSSLQDRYISEDVPYGLVLRSELGRVAGVATPVIDGVIDVMAAATGQDYRAFGRTLRELGLAGWNLKDIACYLATGEDRGGKSRKPQRKAAKTAAAWR